MHTERALLLTLDKRHSSGFSYCKRRETIDKMPWYAMKTYLVEQWLDLLLLLPLTDLVCIRDFEVLRRNIDEPLRLDSGDIMAVLSGRQDQFMVNQPLGVAVEQRRRRVNIDRGPLYKRLVTLLWVFLRGVSEEARANCSSHKIVVLAGRHDVVLIPGMECQLPSRAFRDM